MSQISQKSITGITSITTPAGVDNQFTLHVNDTSEALKLDHAGNIHIHNHVNTTGISSASNFKTGSSNLHSTGLTVGDSFVHSTGINIGSNIKFGSTGVITATSFVGDGSDLTNLPAGLGTALSATASSPLNKMYYTNQVLGVPSSITVDVPASASKAYTQYADIKVESSADLIVAEGDDLIPDVLGLADFGTFGGGASAGRIRVNSISNAANDGSPTVQKGLVVTGVTTSTTFSGSGASLTNLPSAQLTGALPAIDGSNLTGLSGVSVANQADNRLITCTGTTDSLNGEQYLTYTSQSSLNNTDGNGTSLLGGNYLLLKRTTGNTNYINAPLANADLVISADENLLFHTVHTADYNSTERARIDSSGRMMIGNTNASTMFGGANDLVVGNTSGAHGITIITSDSTVGRLLFSDSTSSAPAIYQGQINYNHSTDELDLRTYTGGSITFATGNAEKVRIDSAGRLLVNTTTQSISSSELFEVKSTSSGFSHFRNNHSGYAPIYIDNEYTNTAMAPLITITDGGGNRAGFLLDPNSVFDITGQGAVTLSTGGTVGNATERFRINSSGQVTKPSQASFAVYSNQGGHTLNNEVFPFNTARYNIGSHFNTSNYRFTAPVAGRYLFNFYSIYNTGGSSHQIQYRVNNSASNGMLIHFSHAGGWDNVSYSQMFNLNANDYVTMWSTSSINWHGGSWQLFCGELLS